MLTLYCNSILNQEPRHTQYIQKNLICGSSSLSDEDRTMLTQKGYCFDDQGDNISHLNKYFGDLTGLYYVWKNTNHEFVGTNQYRRFWNEPELTRVGLHEKVLYVSNPMVFDYNMAQQYQDAHGPAGLHILTSAIQRGKIDMTIDTLNKLKEINYISTCNMFFGHKDVFDKVCSILFPMMFELYEGSKYSLDFVQPDKQTRIIAFLAERILTLLYTEREYYFGKDLFIQSINWVYK